MTILTRREYAGLVDAANTAISYSEPYGHELQQALECIASYRVICHHLAPLLHDAIAKCDDRQQCDHLQSLLDDLKRGES